MIAWRRSTRRRSATPPSTTDVGVRFRWCREQGLDTRPQYLWGTLLAVRIAAALELPRVSVLELGVAGGNGLVALERAAEVAERLSGVGVDVVGFDTGRGMPPPTDPRDIPWLIEAGWFAMDEAALRRRLTRATLMLGPVGERLIEFAASAPPPVGFLAVDLDYYSSTVEALRLLDGSPAGLLPRIPAYFDDLFGYGWTDFTGERAAIDEFNQAHTHRKIAQIHGLRYELPVADQALPWPEQMYLIHLFDHPRYGEPEGPLGGDWEAAHQLSRE